MGLANYDKAKLACESKKGYLVEINDQNEENLLKKFFTDSQISGTHFWLGATDGAKEGEWIWKYSGKKISYKNWGSGQPDSYGGGNEDWAIAGFNLWDNKGFGWWDVPSTLGLVAPYWPVLALCECMGTKVGML